MWRQRRSGIPETCHTPPTLRQKPTLILPCGYEFGHNNSQEQEAAYRA